MVMSSNRVFIVVADRGLCASPSIYPCCGARDNPMETLFHNRGSQTPQLRT